MARRRAVEDDHIPQMLKQEAAQYIADMARDLAKIAKRHGLENQALALEIAAAATPEGLEPNKLSEH